MATFVVNNTYWSVCALFLLVGCFLTKHTQFPVLHSDEISFANTFVNCRPELLEHANKFYGVRFRNKVSHVDCVYTGHFSTMSTLDLLSHTLQIPGIWDERSNSLTSLILWTHNNIVTLPQNRVSLHPHHSPASSSLSLSNKLLIILCRKSYS